MTNYEVHGFRTDVAVNVGVNAAIVFNNLSHWINKNKLENKNLRDGKYWTFNSIAVLGGLYPYLTERQIGIAIKKLVDFGYLEKGCFNKVNYDKTSWYTFGEILRQSEMEDTSALNRKDVDVKPIPDSNTYKNTDSNLQSSATPPSNKTQFTSLAESFKDTEKVQIPKNEYIEWVEGNAPTLLKLKNPLTAKQALYIGTNYPEDIWQDVLENMENTAGLLKKYTSANITAKNWLKRRGWLPYDKMKTATIHQAKDVMGNNPRAMEIYKNKNPQAYLQ